MAEEQSEQAVRVCEGDCEETDQGLFDFLHKKKVAGEEKAEEEYLAAGVQNIHIEEGYKAHERRSKNDEDLQEFFEKSEEKEDVKVQEVYEKSEEKKEDEKHHRVLDKLHRSHSSSSSSSDEEEVVEGEGGIKEKIKKKKKDLKEKIEGIVHGEEERHEEEKKLEYVPTPPAEESKLEYVPTPPAEESKLVVEEFELHESAVPEGEKKGFLEKIKEKLPGHSKKPAEEGIVHGEEERHEEEKKPEFVPTPPAEESKLVVEEFELHESAVPEGEKKGFLEKIKEKLPGHGKKPAEEDAAVLQVEAVEATEENVKLYEAVEGPEAKEKKGFLGKIIEKLPGYHKTAVEESDKGPTSH